MADITIRSARSDDAQALGRLAQLDSQRLPAGELVVAEVAGELVAAYAPESTRVIANPFLPTADVVEMLRLRVHGARPPLRERHGLLAALPRPA